MSRRSNFFIIHLGVSLLVASVLFILIFFIWYPDPLDEALGVKNLIYIIFLIDIIIGPCLCWLVYNENKKSLKFDILCVIFLQLSAFFYGTYLITVNKPAWIVFNRTGFEVVTVLDILQANDKKYSLFDPILWGGIKWAAISGFNDFEQQNYDQLSELVGQPVVYHINRYVDFKLASLKMVKESKEIDRLKEINSALKVEKIIKQYPDANAWLPLIANKVDMVVLINKESEKVIKVVDLRPWD